MITALMLLVCAVLVLGWMLALIAFLASIVSIVPRLLESLAHHEATVRYWQIDGATATGSSFTTSASP